ncbi:MAG: caspase family protein [Nitrospira sp.]|nr:caspase family protein [Nitrospira sp.]
MKHLLLNNKLSILIAFLLILLYSSVALADQSNDLRGIGIIARDNVTGTNREVKLYRQMHAVIIGIDKYQNLTPDQQLSYAVKDAKGIENVLREQYSFDNIYTLYNEQATKNGIMEVLQGKLSNVQEDDAVFIFFAGHGTTQKDKLTGADMGYILPYDGMFNKDKMFLNISINQLRDDVAKVIPARHVFYVIDACYSGTLLAQRAGGATPEHDYAYLQEVTKEPVRQVLTAGTDKQTVLDGGPKGHSVFTGRLIEKLEETEDYITAA